MAKPRSGKRVVDSSGTVRIAGKNANGAGSVYRVGDNRWKASFKDPVTGKLRTASGRTQAEAIARREQRIEEILNASPSGRLGPAPTIAELCAWWFDNVATPAVRPTTLHTYRKDVGRIVEHLGDSLVADLDTEAVRSLLATLRADLSAATCRNTRARLRQIAEHAVELGYIASNPVPRVPAPQETADERKTRRVLTPEETRRLLGHLDGSLSVDAAVGLLFTLGMRVSEALGLAWSDVDLDAATAIVRRGVTYTGGGVGIAIGATKTRSTAGVHHLSPTAVELLRRRKAKQAADRLKAGEAWETHMYQGEQLDMVFTTALGGLIRRQDVTNAIQRALKRAGIDPKGVATHTGRRSVVTSLFVAGLPLEDVARHVGHTTPSTTAGYVQDLGSRPKETAAKAAQLLDPAASS